MKLIYFLLFSLSYSFLPCQKLEFFREDLTFELEADFFYVSGFYHFRNTSLQDLKTLLFYPIPQDSLYGKIDEFFTICQQDSTDQLSKSNENGFFFKVEISAKEEKNYQIGYRQKLLGNKAEYILTTTQNWRKPLETVNFLLIFPDSVKIDSLSYLPDSLHLKNGKYHFFYHKKNFMPDKNMVIWIDREKK
jgi:hypothetical protein